MYSCSTTCLSLRSVQQNFTPKDSHQQTNILLFQFGIGHLTWRPTYVVLLPAAYMCHKIIVMQHSTFLDIWQRHIAQQHTQNALLCCHCKNGYANDPVLLYTYFVYFIYIKISGDIWVGTRNLLNNRPVHDPHCSRDVRLATRWSSVACLTEGDGWTDSPSKSFF